MCLRTTRILLPPQPRQYHIHMQLRNIQHTRRELQEAK